MTYSKYIGILCFILFLLTCNYTFSQEFQPENIGRGTVAVVIPDGGVYISWRLLSTDQDSVAFNVYRGTIIINQEPIALSTNFVDSAGTPSDTYSIVPVVNGIEQQAAKEVSAWEKNYKTIPLQRPVGGRTPDGVDYTYSPNDASVGDLDGDGEYEIILKWDPSNSKDNAHSGHTGNVYIDGLKMDGTLLWRLDLGVNVRAGAHYGPFMVYDLNGDGKAEVVCRTASGTKDATGNFISSGPAGDVDHSKDYRNSAGYILTGSEFLTVFNGDDGTELVSTNLEPARGYVGDWGDTYGNRVDRFLAAVVHLGGENPSVVWARGIYTKVELAAWDLIDGELVQRWHFKSQEGYPNWSGMGSHNLSVADVDGDGKDEIIYGNCAIDDDGTGLWTLRSAIGKQTGDAMHLADIDPDRLGLEKWGCHEGGGPGSSLVDAATGEVIWLTADGDVGRATAGDLVDDFFGMECWGGTDGLRSANNERVGSSPTSTNHVVWWDGDLGRELLNSTNIQKYGKGVLLNAEGCSSNNGTKANPCLQADLFGDWREEVIWRTNDNNNLRIYTTTDLTNYKIKTLMHDPMYRLAIAWQNDSYNQPPHTSFYLGFGMFTPDSLRPPAVPQNIRAKSWDDTVQVMWDENIDTDLDGYNIYRGKSENNLSLLKDVGNNTIFIDTNVTNDSTYYYAVTAYDLYSNESKFSKIIQERPTLRPPSPTGLTYRFDKNSALLMWDSQDFEYVAGINIYRSISDEENFVLIKSKDKTVTMYKDSYLTSGQNYLYAISIFDNNSVESFLSESVAVTPSDSFAYQAEDATHYGTVLIENNHLGFRGTGFTNFETTGSVVEFNKMPGFGGGERTMIIRYALGNTSRTGTLKVNGVEKSLTMQNTGDWANWIEDSIVVNLTSGFDNSISFESIGSDFGNLDEITIIPEVVTSVEDGSDNIPSDFQLYQNYPNPFNPQTTIAFALPKSSVVTIKIYNLNGRLISTLVDDKFQEGIHKITFDGSNLASGVYFVHAIMSGENNQAVFTKKILLLK